MQLSVVIVFFFKLNDFPHPHNTNAWFIIWGHKFARWVDNGSFLIELRSTPQTDFESTVLALILWTHLSSNAPATVSRIDMWISALGIVFKNWKPCEDRMHSFREICPKVSSQNKWFHCNLRPIVYCMGQDLGTFIHPPTDQFFFMIMHFFEVS